MRWSDGFSDNNPVSSLMCLFSGSWVVTCVQTVGQSF